MTIEKRQFIANLQEKDLVETVFLVKHIAAMAARDGSTYLNIVLSDSTGDMDGRKWQGAELAVEQVKKGDFVLVRGKVNQFQNRLQLIVQDLVVVDKAQLNLEHFVPKSKSEPEAMYDQLLQLV